MKSLLLMALVLCTITTNATNYYFSFTSGDDTRTSTQAHSSSTPWKSLSKLNSFFINLQPGDSVLLKRGDTFYGSIIIGKSGTSSLPIIIGAYGAGNKPVVTGLTNLTTWASVGGGIYESYNSSLASGLNMVLINDIEQGIGRYPNKNAANKGYLTITSHTGYTSITDNTLPTSPNWKGAEVVIRSSHWTLDRDIITSQSGTTIYYKSSTSYPAADRFGYFIQNNIKTLDQFGEWYLDTASKKLNVFFGSNSPSSYTIKAATINNLVYSSSKSYVLFDNLAFKGTNKENIDINGGSNITVQNCDISFSGIDGINASGSNFKLLNSTVLYSNNDAVNVGGVNSPTVRNNVIKNSYFIAGMGGSGNGAGNGIRNGAHGLVEFNTIINSGFIGIQLGSDYAIVKNNYIDSFCILKDDGGGIYTSNHTNITNTGRQITGNIILNAIGATEGTDASGSYSAHGIYMDDDANGVAITGNTIANCILGLYLHNTRNIVVSKNTIYNNTKQLLMKHDNLGDPLRYHTITNNLFFSKFAMQLASSISTKDNDIGSVGTLDSNYYARPIDDKMVISNTTYLQTSGEDNSFLDLDGWKSIYSKDLSSKRSAKQIQPYVINSLIGSNKVINGDFSSTTSTAWGNSCTTSIQNSGVLDGSYLKVVPSSVSSSIVFSVGGLSAAKKYILRFSLKGSSSMSISAFLRGSDYKPMSNKELRTVTTTRSENEMIFVPTIDDSKGSLQFSVDAQSTYYLDNIKLYEVNASTTNPDDSIKFVVNTTQISKTFTLLGSFVDAKNNKYSNSIVLQPYSSAVLIKTFDATNTTTNLKPTVNITSPKDSAKFNSLVTITITASAVDSDGTISKVDFYNGSTLLGSDNTSPYSFAWNNVAAGNYAITAKATDNSAAVTTSQAIGISVSNPNTAPTVNITSPANNASFTSLASVTINATASDSDGTISKVDFYNGSTLLGSDNTSPYSFVWNNVAAGNYSITAKATDNSAAVTTSTAIGISVSNPNTAPTVSITSPANNTSFNAPASLTINATAADTDGSVTKVDFYNGSTLLGSDNTSPYSFTWNNVAAGNYTIKAKATDNDGAVTTSGSITLIIITPNVAPTVDITSPANNASFNAPASVTINATAADTDGSVTKVDFYNGSTFLGSDNTGPYSFTWNNVAAGNYTIKAKATDNDGAVTTSGSITLIIITPNVAPTVDITSPTNNASFNAPASVTINATAADADGSVTKVDFYNGSTLLGSDNTSPFSFTWSNVAAGKYSITAEATDNSGAITTSDIITLTVTTPNGEPTVSITSPANNASFNAPGTITINATAADSDGSVTKVDFYKGSTLLGSDNTSPYSFTWSNVAAGSYTITAKATDNSDAVTTSGAVVITLITPNVAPTVSITSPATDTSLKGPANIIINAIAADADGSVTKVDFYNGSTLLGSDNTSPYSFTWKNIIRGNYIITAKATDNDGAVSTSASITLNVIKPNMAPTVSITSPVTNTSLNLLETETINIYATASDSDGFVTKVDFYKGATLIGSDSTSPYSFTWNNVAGGDYTITAKATDDSGAVTTSDAVLFSAITSNDAPAVNITSPKMDTSYTGPATIHIAATATDADGTIQKVEFYNGSTLLKTEYKIPYTCSWKNVPVGNYTITAVATDNRGNVTTSESVNVTVKVNIAPTVNITSPEIDQNFTGPAKIYMSAAASDTDGTIKKVEFYIDTTLLHTEYLIPYTYSWENVPGGSYTITAKATDNSGLSTTSSVSVTVTASTNTAPTLTVNAAPTVNITSPVSNSSYDSAQSITIEVAASDSDGTVAKVDFYNGDKLLGTDSTSPYNFTWNNVTPGNYSLTAKGYDDKGSATVSAVVPVVVSSPVAFAFKSFDGTANSKGNQLIWSTTNYKNTSYFKVLRGKRRMSLKQIGKVSYVSSNSTSPNYTFNDSAPYSGTSYYKIVQVDNLGKVVSSGIISVSDTTTVMGKVTATSINTLTEATDVQDKIIANNLKGITIKVGPNPTSDVVSVYTNGLILDKDLRISVLSINGVVLKTIQSKTSNQVVKINVSTFKNGMYIIEIASGDTKVYKQFIKD